MDDEILEEFITESMDALDELEPIVVKLTPDGDNTDALGAVFRHLHSIKGTASFVNLPALTRIAHAAENLLDELRHNTLQVTPHRVDLLCEAIDVIRAALGDLNARRGESSYETRADTLAGKLDFETKRPSTSRWKCPRRRATILKSSGVGATSHRTFFTSRGARPDDSGCDRTGLEQSCAVIRQRSTHDARLA